MRATNRSLQPEQGFICEPAPGMQLRRGDPVAATQKRIATPRRIARAGAQAESLRFLPGARPMC
jgi:hypothetical protein